MFAEDYENAVYACHDYARAGMSFGGPYPGETQGVWVDRDAVEETFLERTSWQRETGTPMWVGEFGPVYTGDPERDEQRYQLLADQLRSTSATARAGRSGPTRTSACRDSCTRRPTARTWPASAT